MFFCQEDHICTAADVFLLALRCEIEASHVNATLWPLSRPKALLLHCQRDAKAEASRPPKSASQSATSQSALAVVDAVFLENLYKASCASTAALPSVAAAFGCAQCMHSLGLSPPRRTCHGSMCGHLPPLSLLFLLILGSPANARDMVRQRSLPCHQPALGAWVAQLPGCQQPHVGTAWLLCQLRPVPGHGTSAISPWPLGWCPVGQFGKRQGGGSKQGFSSFPGTCQGLQLFVGL